MKTPRLGTGLVLLSLLWAAPLHAADPGDPDKGAVLADAVRTQRPAGPTSSKGVLRIRREDGRRITIPVEVQVMLINSNSWTTMYRAEFPDRRRETLSVINYLDGPSQFVLIRTSADGNITETNPEKPEELFVPFAGTDFWIMDLGMAFLHWPDQRWVRRETRRTRTCNVLESRNPNPSATPGGYSRVLTWVDEETDGIVRAEAYDNRNRLLKEFSPGSFAKVGSHYELREMEIRNEQTDSRTTLQFQIDDPGKLGGIKHLPGGK